MTRLKDASRGWPVIGRPGLRRDLKAVRRRAHEAVGSDRRSRLAINGIDELLWAHTGFEGGTFLEAGAHDGTTYSCTYWLERFKGWRGVLVEPVAEQAARARRARPVSQVVHGALVDPARAGSRVELVALDLVSTVAGAFGDPLREARHVGEGTRTQPVAPSAQVAPGVTLSGVLDRAGVERLDLLCLDVEGSEVPALQGLDLTRHRPGLVLVEVLDDADHGAIAGLLGSSYEDLGRVTPQDHLFRLR